MKKGKDIQGPWGELFYTDKIFQVLAACVLTLFAIINIVYLIGRCPWLTLNYVFYAMLIAFGYYIGYARCKSNIRKSQNTLKEMICE